MSAIRNVNAKVADYLDCPFPATVQEMQAEFSELVEEIEGILNPIVEAEDDYIDPPIGA